MSSSPAESGRRGKPNLQGIDRRGSATAAARSKISPILVFGFFPFEFKISGISASWERPITKRGEDRQWQRRLWPASTAKSHRLEHFSHLMKVKLLLFRRDKCDKKKFCYRLIVIWIRRYFWTAGLWYHLHLFQIDIPAQGCRPRTRWGQCWTNWWAPRETVSHEIPQAMWFSWSSIWSLMKRIPLNANLSETIYLIVM